MSSNPCIFPDNIYGQAVEDMYREVARAKAKHGEQHFNSFHEGFAVLNEEVDELWDEVKKDNYDLAIKEAVQVGAMAIRFVAEMRRKIANRQTAKLVIMHTTNSDKQPA